MPKGLEFWTKDGHLQFTNDLVYFRLEQKIVLPTTGWDQFPTTSSTYDLNVPGLTLTDAPMIALSGGATWAYISDTSSGITWTIMKRNADANPTAYIFSKRPPPSDPGKGFAIYKNNSIVYSSEYPIMRPIGVITQGGYAGIDPTGRTCAHVPQKQGTSMATYYTNAGYGSCIAGGQYGYQVYQNISNSRTAIRVNGDAISSDLHATVINHVPVNCSSSPQVPVGSSAESPNFSSLIIDVTNL